MSATSRLGALAVCAAALALAFSAQAAPPPAFEYPAALAPKLAGLSADELAFIKDGQRLEPFGLTPERLSFELSKRDAAAVKAYVRAFAGV
jgi:hypothetical protein